MVGTRLHRTRRGLWGVLIISLFLLFPVFAVQQADAKQVRFRAVDQSGRNVRGAFIKVEGYGNAPAGKKIDIPVGKKVTFSGSISGLRGGALQKTVDSSVKELVYPFKRVAFYNRDQNGKDIPGSTILVKGYKKVKNGASLVVPFGMTISFRGQIFSLEGEYIKKRVIKGVDELVYPFLTVPFTGRDEQNTYVPGSTGFISGYGTVKSGGTFSVPKGVTIKYRGRLAKLDGQFVSRKIDKSLKELVYPFRKVTFTAKDQHGKVLKNARVFVGGYGIIPSGESIILPREADIVFKVDVLTPSINTIGDEGDGKTSGYKIDYKGNATSTYVKDRVHSRMTEVVVPVVMDFGIPVANAGTEKVMFEKGKVKMDGSSSYSPGGSPLSFVWTQTGGEKVELLNSLSSTPEFVVPPNLSTDEDLEFQLVVYDGKVKSDPDMLVIKVKDNSQLLASKKSDDNWGDF